MVLARPALSDLQFQEQTSSFILFQEKYTCQLPSERKLE